MREINYYCDMCNEKFDGNETLTYVTFSKYLSSIMMSEEYSQTEVCKDCLSDIKSYIKENPKHKE